MGCRHLVSLLASRSGARRVVSSSIMRTMMAEVRISETSFYFSETTRRFIIEGSHHLREI
jgi:hypothetical protein